ncbi:DUF6685 family protein [Escherichia coli]|uniref:DUF6685 family protein n=1 Tax=Escherichia coli TaxID=562 RepID=UPI0032DB4F3A
MEHDIRNIDEFPVLRCRELAEPVTEEHQRKNMRHWELRLDRMLFAEYPWAKRRLYWLNDGSSHHFGAARYQLSGMPPGHCDSAYRQTLSLQCKCADDLRYK